MKFKCKKQPVFDKQGRMQGNKQAREELRRR
jgi:hypothetical protein